MYIYIIILYPDEDRRPMTPWLTPHFSGFFYVNKVLSVMSMLSKLVLEGGTGLLNIKGGGSNRLSGLVAVEFPQVQTSTHKWRK